MALERIGSFDDLTLARMRDCTEAGLPLCLEGALRLVFGNNGKRLFEAYLNIDGDFDETAVSTPKDVWRIYERFVANFKDRLGEDVSTVIESETLKEIESLQCSKCPLYETVRGKLDSLKS